MYAIINFQIRTRFVKLCICIESQNGTSFSKPFSLITASQIFTPETSWQFSFKELQYTNPIGRNPLETDHMLWPQLPYIKRSAPLMPDHIKSGADFMTTYLTTFRTGLPGDSSTRRTLYQFFRTKKHVLDAISRKKLYPFAWGGRGRKFKSCHSDQKSGVVRFPIFLCIYWLFRTFWGAIFLFPPWMAWIMHLGNERIVISFRW